VNLCKILEIACAHYSVCTKPEFDAHSEFLSFFYMKYLAK